MFSGMDTRPNMSVPETNAAVTIALLAACSVNLLLLCLVG
jgi:hypothetical protein